MHYLDLVPMLKLYIVKNLLNFLIIYLFMLIYIIYMFHQVLIHIIDYKICLLLHIFINLNNNQKFFLKIISFIHLTPIIKIDNSILIHNFFHLMKFKLFLIICLLFKYNSFNKLLFIK